jgi:hypothetical protein
MPGTYCTTTFVVPVIDDDDETQYLLVETTSSKEAKEKAKDWLKGWPEWNQDPGKPFAPIKLP